MNEERTFNVCKRDRSFKADDKSLINQNLCLPIKKLEVRFWDKRLLQIASLLQYASLKHL